MKYNNFELSNFFNLFYDNFKNGSYEYNSDKSEEQDLFKIFKKALRINVLKYKHSEIEKYPDEFKDRVYETYKNFYMFETK